MAALGRTRCNYASRTLFDCRVGLDMSPEISRCRNSHGGTSSLSKRGYPATSTSNMDESPSQKSTLRSEQPCNVQVKSRGVIRVDGPDILKFLQGLVTNDVSRLMNGPREREKGRDLRPPAMYTAILNPQGRFLYDLFLYRPQHSTEETGDGLPFLLADVDSSLVAEVISHLTRHRLRAKVGLENLSGELNVWQRFGGITASHERSALSAQEEVGGPHSESSVDLPAKFSHRRWCWYRDPRLAELGLRGVFPSNSIPPSVNPGQVFDERHYLSWRLDHGVPEGSSEIPRGEAIPLEFNLAGLQAISFDKGCYVGQELVARTHHRGVIRKRVMPVQFFSENGTESQGEVAVGTDIVDTVSNKKVGKVTTRLGSRGLGLIRLDSARKSSSHLKLDVSDDSIHLQVIRPKWWPGEWGGEDLQQTVANA